MSLPYARQSTADPLRASAERAATAALRELPEALIVVFDHELRLVQATGQALERLGDHDSWRAGAPLRDALPTQAWQALAPLLRSALAGETRSREIWMAGQRHCLMVDVGPLRSQEAAVEADDDRAETLDDRTAAIEGGVAVLLDITARRRAQALSTLPAGGFEEIFERAPIGAGLLDRDGRWLLVNRALCDITGYTVEELLGRGFEEIVHPADVENDLEDRRRLRDGEIQAYRAEKRCFDAAGELISTIVSMSLVRDHDGAPLHYIAQLQDVSERRRMEEEQRRLADHDPLTGLRDRRLFANDLELQIARSRRYGEVAGLMRIDIEQLRAVGELHGEQVADELVKAVSRTLVRRLRGTDLVGRLGREQFAVLLPHIDEDGLAVVADSLTHVIAASGVEAGEQIVHPLVRIGFTMIDAGTESVEAALITASRAMSDARHDGHAGI